MSTQRGGVRPGAGAPPGNRNAATLHGAGLRYTDYLNGTEIATLDELLCERGQAPTNATRAALARELRRRAVADIARAQSDNAAIIV